MICICLGMQLHALWAKELQTLRVGTEVGNRFLLMVRTRHIIPKVSVHALQCECPRHLTHHG